MRTRPGILLLTLGLTTAALASAVPEGPAEVADSLANDPDPRVRRWAAWRLGLSDAPLSDGGMAALVQATGDRDGRVRDEACTALTRLNRVDPTAVASRAAEMPRPDLSCLVRLGDRAVPALTDLLAPERPLDLRVRAARSLAELGPVAAGATEALVARITEGGSRLERHHASIALGKIGTPAVAPLLALLEEGRANEFVCRGLQGLGPEAAAAAPGLDALAAAETADWRLRAAALAALGAVSSSDTVERRMIEVLGSSSHDAVRETAARNLGHPAAGPDAVQALIDATRRGSARVARNAALALAACDAAGRDALAALLRDEDAVVRAHAAGALATTGASAVSLLIEALDDTDESVRDRSRLSLLQIGDDAVPGLLAAAADTSAQRKRRYAVLVLGQLETPPAEAVPVLRAALAGSDLPLRQLACWTLGKLGAASLPALEDLVAVMADADPLARRNAVWALGNIGPRARAARPALIAAGDDPDADVRTQAAEALQKVDGTYVRRSTGREEEP